MLLPPFPFQVHPLVGRVDEQRLELGRAEPREAELVRGEVGAQQGGVLRAGAGKERAGQEANIVIGSNV